MSDTGPRSGEAGMDLGTLLRRSAEIRDACTTTIVASKAVLPSRDGNEILFAHSSLVMRANKHHRAIELLLRQRLPTEAAILCLSQFECRILAFYIGEDAARARHWMNHDTKNDAPWRMMRMIRSVYSDVEERQANLYTFQFLSGIKHASPTAGSAGFGFRHDDGTVHISNYDPDDRITENFSRTMAYLSISQLVEHTIRATNVLVAGIGLPLADAEKLNAVARELKALREPLIADVDLHSSSANWVTPHVLMKNLERWGRFK